MCVRPKSWRGHCVAAHCTRGDWSYPSELVMVGGNHESSSPTSHMSGFTLVVGVLLSSVRHVAVATLLSTLSLAALISRSSLYKLHPPTPPVVLTRLHYFIVVFFCQPSYVAPFSASILCKGCSLRRKCFYFFGKCARFMKSTAEPDSYLCMETLI